MARPPAARSRPEGDVGDLAAADAQQVVMVLGQVLGQFEAGELVAGRDPADQPGVMQNGQCR